MGIIALLQYALSFLIALSIIIRLFFPPLAMFLYLLFSLGETLGVAKFSYIAILTPPLYSALIMASVISFNKLKQRRYSSAVDKRLFFLGALAVFCALWIYMSGIVNGRGTSLAFSWYIAGPCSMIITLAYYRDKRFKPLLFTYIFIQVSLAFMLTLSPDGPLRALNAFNYTGEPLELMDIGGRAYGIRLSGQFTNTVQMSYYGAIALAIGVYIAILYRSFLMRIAGIALALAGFTIQFISLTRGVIMGLALGFLLSLTQGRKKARNIFLLFALSILTLSFLSSIPFLKPPEFVLPLLDRFDYVSSDIGETSYRMIAREIAFNNILNHPLFGYGSNEVTVNKFGYVAHEEPLTLALIYGIPVGACFLLIIILCVMADLKRGQRGFLKWKSQPGADCAWFSPGDGIYTVFLWTTIFLVMTNAIGGKSLTWVILAIVSIPWAESVSWAKRE